MLNEIYTALENSDFDQLNDVVVYEDAITKELNSVVKTYTKNIKNLNHKIDKAMKEKDYKSAEKYLLEKRKIVETIEDGVKHVKVTKASSVVVANIASVVFPLPAMVRISSWTRGLGGSTARGVVLGVTLGGLLTIMSLINPTAASAAKVIQDDNMRTANGLKDNYTHPNKSNLLTLTKDAIWMIDKEIKKVKELQKTESKFNKKVYEYIDTILEEEI